jgi:hypothetical protein
MLSNVMSLVPKIDEVNEFIIRNEINLALITETWLKESMSDSVIDIPNFTLLCRDRTLQNHGGVCAYIRESQYKYKRLDDLNCCDDHECLWIYLRPTRLPRGFTCIIIAVIYHPPGADGKLFQDHLFQTLTLVESKYPNCGIIITGDFNRLNVTRLLNHFRLKQIVKIPTRNDATLDLILTNMHKFYNPPQGYPGFGLSDHNTIVATGKTAAQKNNTKKSITIRDQRKSRKLEMGRYLSSIDWTLMLSPLDTCENMWTVFHEVVHSGLDTIMPEKQIRIHPADAPWMNQKLKSLIFNRQKAFNAHGVHSPQFKYYRNCVNRERKVCRAKYYESNIKQLKGEAPRKWWNEVKRLSGIKSAGTNLSHQINVEGFTNLPPHEQANTINTAFLAPLAEYRISEPLERLPLEDPPKFLEVTEERVQKVLAKLNPHKAPGPDNLSNWIFKEYSYLLALPVMKIINASYYEQQLPTIWKKANVSPLPKKKPVTILEKDLRPISLTPCISKVAEEFIVEDYVKPAILDIIDASQYGAIPNSSTTMALISMLHHWFINTDGNGATIRTLLFDYRKAFDFIDHTILVKKLGNLNIPRSIINWIIDFLSHRTQRVKLADSCFSEWGHVPSGVPQGTKLGPWLFILMIQDLNINSPYLWKFVDDTTASEILPKGNVSTAQNIADHIKQWSEENRLKLHPDKCKELRISFSKDPVVLDQVILNGKEVEIVESAKLLGVTISNNLSWHAHIKEVVKKASKRLYYLVQLKRARLPAKDLVLFYTSCVRSVMDYAVPAFYHSLPQYLKNELIRLEKRAISIINPGMDYSATGEILNIKPIEEHHNFLCKNLFDNVTKDPNHKLYDLLPQKHNWHHDLRNGHEFDIPHFNTNRTKNSFIFAMASKMFS